MATPSKPVGYECEFVDQVPEDYFCKQCKHVAREPNITSCCIEAICQVCFDVIIQDKQPCPSCESTDISTLGPHKKYQPKILALKVHCSLKNRGCEWTGQLQHLDAHLDLTTGDCVYVDVDCPSKCNQKVQKRNVDTHLANHCPNRDYTCPHCFFKATFREVSEHFEVCQYYPLVCPNRCGASFERDVFEDHIKMCGLQKVQCEFSYAGCGAEFIRDDQKEHMEQNTQKHLALVAAATLRISQEQQREFDQKLEDKDSEIKAIVNNEASQLVNEQRRQSEAQIKELKEKLQEQQQIFKQDLDDKDAQIKELQRVLEEKLEEKDQQIKTLREHHDSVVNSLRMDVGIPPYEFTLTNYQEIRAKRNLMMSSTLSTHPGGIRFVLFISPSGTLGGRSYLSLGYKPEHTSAVKLPAKFTITLELLNQHRDQDHYRRNIQCDVDKDMLQERSGLVTYYNAPKYIRHTDLEWNEDKQTQYLKNDCLKFRIIKVLFVAN